MATSSSRNTGAGSGPNASRYVDDDAEDNVTSIPDFFRGERTWLWPVWVLAVLMLLIIAWDRFVQF